MRAILTYHSIDPSGSVVSIDPATFHRHVSFLRKSAVRVVPLDELLTLPAEADAVSITFDDAFENFALAAWPLLSEHGLPVTLFVVSDYVGRTNAWDQKGHPDVPRLRLLDWDGIVRLVEEGVTIASHSRSHPYLTSVPPQQLEEEVAGSATAIRERTGVEPSCFAYPYGDVDGRVVKAVSQRYALACTTEFRALGPDVSLHQLPRLDAYYFRRPGSLEAWGSANFRRRLWLRGRARNLRQKLTGHRA